MTELPEHDETSAPADHGEPTLRTILMVDLADSTGLMQRLGDQRGAELIRRHDRFARDLLRRYRGREIDKTNGFLLLFERPIQAVGFALEYQRRLQELAELEGVAIAARVGIHVGEVVIWENAAEEIARGAKPVEVEGLAKPVAARLMGLALAKQILMTGVAYGLAQRAEAELRAAGRIPQWTCHGDYRFPGVLETTLVFEVGEADVAPLCRPPNSAQALRILPWWQRPAALISALAMVLACVASLAYLALRPEPGIAFAARDWVVVGDLDNRTGQTLFDESLDLAFRQGLSQSRYVNVLSRLQIRDALTRMKLDPEATTIERSVGTELAQRETARALFLPSVADTGGAYRVSVEVIDPISQATVWVVSESARNPEDLLPAMDAVIDRLRGRLGESLAAIEAGKLPLTQATTSNLEALRSYSMGRQLYEQLKYDDARRLFEHAIELDPEFAMAYAGIASTYLPFGRFAEGLPPAKKAASLRTRLSTREAMYLDALLAWAEDPERGVSRWTDYANLYPDLGAGPNNAGLNLWQDLNRCPEAVVLFDQAFRSRDPQRAFAGHSKGYCQLWSGQATLAEQSFREALQINPLAITQGLADVYTYQELFDRADAALSANRSGLPPQFSLEADARRITWLAYQGRLREARVAAQALAPAALAAGLPATASRARIYDAALALHSGETLEMTAFGELELPLLAAVQAPQYQASLHLSLLAVIAQRHGQETLARDWLAQIRAHPPQRPNPTLQVMLRVLDARLAKTPEQGLAILQIGNDGHDRMQVRIAAAQLAQASGNRALEIEQLDWIDTQRGRAFAEFTGYFAAQTLNVLDINHSLLRRINLETDPKVRANLQQRLMARWQHADEVLRSQLPKP